tara:strand:+ start:50231 stop:50815 length:585 start_codon:yes stop_codon:yes gene_type:complete
MSKVFSTIFFILLITLISTSPVPSIPLVILNYKVNGLIAGYIASLVGGLIASVNQFYLSKNFLLKFIRKKYPKKYLYINKYSKIVYGMTYIEFIFLLFSGVIPNSIISISAGVAKMSFRKFITCYFIVALPQQLIFLFAATQIENLEGILKINGLDKFNSIVLSLAIVSFIAFAISFILRMVAPKIFRTLDKKY